MQWVNMVSQMNSDALECQETSKVRPSNKSETDGIFEAIKSSHWKFQLMSIWGTPIQERESESVPQLFSLFWRPQLLLEKRIEKGSRAKPWDGSLSHNSSLWKTFPRAISRQIACIKHITSELWMTLRGPFQDGPTGKIEGNFMQPFFLRFEQRPNEHPAERNLSPWTLGGLVQFPSQIDPIVRPKRPKNLFVHWTLGCQRKISLSTSVVNPLRLAQKETLRFPQNEREPPRLHFNYDPLEAWKKRSQNVLWREDFQRDVPKSVFLASP